MFLGEMSYICQLGLTDPLYLRINLQKKQFFKRDKEGHYIMIKGSIQEEDTTIINIYAPNIGAPQYTMQMLTSMKGEINSETQVLNDSMDQLDLIDIYRTFHPKTMNFIFS